MSAPAFPAELLAEIRARLPLDCLIGRTVPLKRTGKSWRGECPFCSGKSPRFSVYRNRYRCFSCGERGDAIAYTMAQDGVGFISAVRRLAADAGVELPVHHRQHQDDPVLVAPLAAERATKLAERQREREAEEAAVIAAAIADAQEIWRECVPLEATLGERHLVETRGIPRPASGWPECVAWHPALRMVVAAGTTEAGERQFIHRIYLYADGQDARRKDGSKRKTSRGAMNGAAIRLPGTGDTLHAEGLETGLSAWIATGNPVLIYCGAVASRMQPQPGRNIVLRDDDPPGLPADLRLIEAMQRWREAGIDFAVAQPWPERRGDKSDFNDLLRESGPEAVRARIAAASHQTTHDNSPFPITPDMVPPGGGGGDPPPPEPDPEPPEDWQRARPPQGEPILLPPPVPGLPAFYPAPTEDTGTAKACLDAAMLDHMNKGMRLLAMHYGDLRGKNNYQHAPGLLAISAENIGIGDVEAMARAFLATDPMPFVSMDHPPTPEDSWKRWEHQWHYWATRMRRMSDGTLSPIEMPVHPNPRVQAVMELTREDELIQAVDRLRSIWNRRQLVLLNNLCLDVSYDAVYRHRHLVQGGNPIERALLATGILPHTPELLHRAHRGIFRTPKAAEHALARNSPQFPGGTLFWDLGVVRFRRAGQHGPEAKATVDRTRWPDNAALIAAIEAFAGPLHSFEGVLLHQGETPTPEPIVPMGAGWVPPAPRQPGSGAAPPSVWVHGPPDG